MKIFDRRRIAVWSAFLLLSSVGAAVRADPPPAAEDAASASASQDDAGKPRIDFATLKHDFGDVDSGQTLETTFGFKNAGDGVLVIENVKGG